MLGDISPEIHFDEPLWCPHSLDQESHQIYWACVKGTTFWGYQKPSDITLARLDEFIPLVAHMVCEHKFDDASLAPLVARLGPEGGLVHTIRTMPDICHLVFSLGFWTKKVADDWAVLLTKATPLPCKARNLENSFSQAVEHTEVYDFLIRVLFGCFLGLYGGHKAPFWTRVWCYAVFVVYPPSVKQFQKFIMANKAVVSICVETFILFSMKQTPFHDYLVKNYQWAPIYENRFEAMKDLQLHVQSVAVDRSFLTRKSNWTGLDEKLQTYSVEFKKYCFRPLVQDFGSRMYEQAFKIWRKNSQSKCYSGLLTIPQEYFEYVWSIPYDVHNQRHFDAYLSMLPSHLFGEIIIQRWNDARTNYYMEQNMTGPQHLLAGTEKKKTGLYYTDPQLFFDLFAYCLVFTHRLKLRWGLLPRSWALSQADALASAHGTLSPDAGVYYICPNCCKIRTKPVTFPNGQFKNKRERARYCHDVRIDFGNMVAYCKDYSPRRKKQILKRRKRKQKNDEEYENGDNIKVCSQTPLVRFCMVGVMLTTEQDGNLALCVDCGTMIAWTPECVSERGPTCGCRLKELETAPLAEPSVCASCDRQLSPRSRTRTHTVFNDVTGEIEEIRVCRGHHTHWEHKLQYMFPKSQLLQAIRDHQYAYMYNGSPIFKDRR